MTMYTVKQLAGMAGVSNRTLHYYDQIGLLRPAAYGDNGYRYYDDKAVLRLQQILFYRELDFSLEQIKKIIGHPDFDLLGALEGHKRALQERVRRLDALIDTVDNTMKYIRGEIKMDQKDFYKGFDEEQQSAYEKEVRERFGDEAMSKTKDWNANSPAQKNDILAELHEIGEGCAANMDKGYDSPDVQAWISRWHQMINEHFYECSLEVFEALGHMYTEDERFTATYEAIRPGMAAFMEKAMVYYCQTK